MSTGRSNDDRNDDHRLNLDRIITTQPELGPSIPDGGYGWIVFLATLFFQMVIPSLVVNFGIFLTFTKYENGRAYERTPMLWDEPLLYVALLHFSSRTFFDCTVRKFIFRSTWPTLVATGGTCLVCAGLLFMWMGMTDVHGNWLYVVAGLLSGLGASILMVQCEVLLAQYFRIKLPILNHISQDVAALAFVLGPFILGHHILNDNVSKVLLWYQAAIVQGLIVSIAFRKPFYLKSRQRKPYQFISVSANADDEEDIFSKNSRELQITRQTSEETRISKIRINNGPEASSSSNPTSVTTIPSKDWEGFEEHGQDSNYKKNSEWETFKDEEEQNYNQQKNWESFEEDSEPPSPKINNLSLAEETKISQDNSTPLPLFTGTPVNNNNTYAFDDDFVPSQSKTANVFLPNYPDRSFILYLEVFKRPTFYKSLLLLITEKYSMFLFYSIFPSYLFVEVESIQLKHLSSLIGALSLVTLLFLPAAFWINIDKKKRPILLWISCWIGCFGYFMISDFTKESVLLAGAVEIIVSINAIQHFGKPCLGLTIKGEMNDEYGPLTILSGLSLLLILVRDTTYKEIFRLMAVLHFFTGTLWLANFIYKKIRIS